MLWAEIVFACAIVALVLFGWSRRRKAGAGPGSGESAGLDNGVGASAEKRREAVEETERRLAAFVQTKCADARVFHYGAFDSDPRYLVFFVTIQSDEQRDAFLKDASIPAEFWRLLKATGFPAVPIEGVHLCFESEETVAREYGGSWWMRIK